MTILNITNSCEESGQITDSKHLKFLRNKCDKKDQCKVENMKKMFGNNRCEDTLDGGYTILYRCDGGQSSWVTSCGRGCTARGCTGGGGSESVGGGGGGEGNRAGEDFVSDGGECVSLLILFTRH